MTSKSDDMESTTLLNKKTNEESSSLRKYLTPKYAIAATATIALGALGVASQSSSFGRGQLKLGSSNTNTSNNKVVVRQSRLGAGSPQTISLHTGCSPLNKLPFDTSSDWTGKIGAKVVSKSMQSDFRFENAQNLQETSCGNYEGTVDLEVGEEFGFYLYPLGDESDESTVLDNGCLHEGDGRCPAFSSPSALAGIEQCTSKYSDPGSGDVFYNRVFDGETMAYNWGTCETTCANSGPPGCPQISTEPEVLDAQTCPISSGTGDAGYTDNYRGWYDASGCGICQDYCRWVGNSGSGGDPSTRTSSGDSFWSCRKAGGKASNPGTNQKDFCPDPSNTNIRNVGGCGSDNYSARGYYGDTFTFEKCAGQGVQANPITTPSSSSEPELMKFESVGTYAYTAPQTGMAKILVVGGGVAAVDDPALAAAAVVWYTSSRIQSSPVKPTKSKSVREAPEEVESPVQGKTRKVAPTMIQEKLVRTPYSKTSSLLAVEVAVHLGTKAAIRADREAAVSMVTLAAPLCNPLNLD